MIYTILVVLVFVVIGPAVGHMAFLLLFSSLRSLFTGDGLYSSLFVAYAAGVIPAFIAAVCYHCLWLFRHASSNRHQPMSIEQCCLAGAIAGCVGSAISFVPHFIVVGALAGAVCGLTCFKLQPTFLNP